MALLLSSCWSWIPLLWRPGNDNDSFEHLPDDILIDILSRLPAVSVVRSRRVCKRWQSLMSTTSFAELHAEKAKLTILLKHEDDCIYIEDEELKNKKRYPFVMRRKEVAAWWLPICSCNGLLLFLRSVLYIWNPVTGEYVSLPIPQHRMLVSSFFFHPIKKEYTVLSYVTDNKVAWFEMLSLRTRSWRRLSGFLANFPQFYPHSFSPPPVVCGAMHWVFYTRETKFAVKKTRSCLHFIMRLNLQSEELDTLPHPDEQSFLRRQETFFLLEMEERLSLFSCPWSGDSFDVWMLMDYEKWSWVRRYRISLKSNRPLHPFGLPGRMIGDIRIVNGDLLLYWYGNGGLYSCDLQTSKLRRIVVQGVDWQYARIFEHDVDPCFFPLGPTFSLLEPHVNTIVSLQNLYGYKGEFDFPPIKMQPASSPFIKRRGLDMVENFLYRAKMRLVDGYVPEETITVISSEE